MLKIDVEDSAGVALTALEKAVAVVFILPLIIMLGVLAASAAAGGAAAAHVRTWWSRG